MWPLASHPTNKNELIAWDLTHDPAELASLNADILRQRLFTRAADLPEGMARLPVKTIHLNKSPMVIGNLKTLSPAMAARWGIDVDQALQFAAVARDLPDMSAIWTEVFRRPADTGAGPIDVEQDLYGGFIGNGDRRRLNQLRALSPAQLSTARSSFDDARLEEIVFRYRARNFPATLTTEEVQRWDAHRAARLLEGAGGARTVEQLFGEIDTLSEAADDRGEAILGALYDYATAIAPEIE
jgi:exodeoxyribonuclease-1